MKNYSNILFNSGPVQATDYINDRYDIVHEKLYKTALNKLIIDLGEDAYKNEINFPQINPPSHEEYIQKFVNDYKNTHKFLEIKNDEYFKPSSVLSISIIFPYVREKYDLSKYWNIIPEEKNNKDISLLQLDEDTIKYAELIYIDYVKGKCKFKSKLSGEEFWTTFDYINDKTKVSDTYSLKDTFTYKIQNRLFEE